MKTEFDEIKKAFQQLPYRAAIWTCAATLEKEIRDICIHGEYATQSDMKAAIIALIGERKDQMLQIAHAAPGEFEVDTGPLDELIEEYKNEY